MLVFKDRTALNRSTKAVMVGSSGKNSARVWNIVGSQGTWLLCTS